MPEKCVKEEPAETFGPRCQSGLGWISKLPTHSKYNPASFT